MPKVILSSQNQVTIPKVVRQKLNIQGGDRLITAAVTNNKLVLRKEPTYRELIGTLPNRKISPVERIRLLR